MNDEPTERNSEPVIGWNGRFFEDFQVGVVYYHSAGKTVTATDNQWFALLTQNSAKVHVDATYAAQTEFGRPLVVSTYTLALVTGQSTSDLSMNVMANLGWERISMPAPVFEGDSIHSRSKILAARLSHSRKEVGIVTVASEGFNQDGTVVLSFVRSFMVYRRGYGPKMNSSRPDESSLPDTYTA
ncbi:MAG: MaoC family dehydratase [Cryobacterium sp.]|nr:MaoC family dehydratase [Cryobacterium sp.]